METIEKDIERVNNDIRNAQYDLKRLPKDREAEFEGKYKYYITHSIQINY